jgi:NAD(P)H-dependent FMN reductase
MYTIISATNRKGSNTLKVAKQYQSFFKSMQVDTTLYTLENFTSMHRDGHFDTLEKEILIPTEKFIFIMPEYNGSFPGIFKLLMDISDIKQCLYYKKVMLVGVANGRAGNLRGIDNMTNMCHYMKMDVFHEKLPLSNISAELNEDAFFKENTIQSIQHQIEGYINY